MLTDLQPPPTEPITLAETKTFLRIDHAAEDALIETLITSARERLEARLGLAFITRPLQLSTARSGEIALPRWPVTSVQTVTADGAPAPDYQADLRKRPCTVTVCARDHVEIGFTAGYGPDPSDVPAPLRQAMLLLVARSYEFRGDGAPPLPLMVDALTLPYRIGIYAPDRVADDIGGTVTSWAFQRAVWASVVPKTINESWENGRLSITETFRLTVRYTSDFPHRARIVWRGRTLRVVAVSDPDTRGERLHLVCEAVIR